MTVAIVFHDDSWFAGGLIIVNDDEICPELLCIKYFLREFTGSSLDEHIGLSAVGFQLWLVVCIAKLFIILSLGYEKLANGGFTIRYVPEIGQSVIYSFRNDFACAFRYVDLQVSVR